MYAACKAQWDDIVVYGLASGEECARTAVVRMVAGHWSLQ
jgi:hypothetical protein